MHGLLALSALHLASIHTEEAHKYARLCDKHQTIALAKYRSILASASEVDMNSADALFAFSTTLSVCAMARSCSPIFMTQAQTIDLDAIIEPFYLTRGVRDVMQLCHAHIRSGPMSQMFHGHSYPEGTVITLPDEVAAHITALDLEMLPAAQLDAEALEHCHAALTELKDVYQNIVYFTQQGDGLESGQVWRWCVAISSGFLRLIQARIPAALVILAHFAAATNAVRMSWYTENWGTYALHGIKAELDAEYWSWLEWPLRHGGRNMEILGVQEMEIDDRRPLIGF